MGLSKRSWCLLVVSAYHLVALTFFFLASRTGLDEFIVIGLYFLLTLPIAQTVRLVAILSGGNEIVSSSLYSSQGLGVVVKPLGFFVSAAVWGAAIFIGGYIAQRMARSSYLLRRKSGVGRRARRQRTEK